MEIVTIWQLVAWKENVKVTAWRIGSGQCHKKWHGFVLYPGSAALCSAWVVLRASGMETSETHCTSLAAVAGPYNVLNPRGRSCSLCTDDILQESRVAGPLQVTETSLLPFNPLSPPPSPCLIKFNQQTTQLKRKNYFLFNSVCLNNWSILLFDIRIP